MNDDEHLAIEALRSAHAALAARMASAPLYVEADADDEDAEEEDYEEGGMGEDEEGEAGEGDEFEGMIEEQANAPTASRLHPQFLNATVVLPAALGAPAPRDTRSSSFIGVSQYKRTQRFEAHIWLSNSAGGLATSSKARAGEAPSKSTKKGRQLHLGSFPNAAMAAVAYDRAAYFIRGPGAELNFPDTDYANDPLIRALAPRRLGPEDFCREMRNLMKKDKRLLTGQGVVVVTEEEGTAPAVLPPTDPPAPSAVETSNKRSINPILAKQALEVHVSIFACIHTCTYMPLCRNPYPPPRVS